MVSLVQLTDGVLLLRPPRLADLPHIVAAVRESLEDLHPWLDWATPAYDDAAAARWLEFTQQAWEHASAFPFATFDAQTGEYLGNCGIDGLDEKRRCCNLGYWVRTSRRGQGIATRAIRLVSQFAFETLRLTRIEIVIAAQNFASQRTAQKAGARYQGQQPNGLLVRSQTHEAVIYALTSVDYRP